jgi:hypothetical protein
MNATHDLERRISDYYAAEAPYRAPHWLLTQALDVIDTTPQRRTWARRPWRIPTMRSTSARLGLTSVAIATVGLVGMTFLWGSVIGPATSPSNDARSAFVGTWFSTSDADGGTQTMTVRASGEDGVEIVVTDDIASVCSRTASTMTGTGRLVGDTRLLIPSPAYTCDDGTKAVAMSGAPLQEQLRNLSFVLDAEAGYLTDNFRGMWLRDGGAAPSPAPRAAAPSPAPRASDTSAPQPSDTSAPRASDSAPQPSGTMWPQSGLEEVRQAQAFADAGDRAYTWQVDPQLSFDDLWLDRLNQPGTEIAERFLREEMGWDKFLFNPFVGDLDHGAADRIGGIGYMRCGPGDTNPLYPGPAVDLMTAPLAEPCAPSIDDLRYESLILDLTQPGQGGPTGVWVVSGWRPTAPFAQADPEVATAEAQARLEDHLQARIEGKGAEGSVDGRGMSVDIPLLYATTSGASYERYEIERSSGPTWPFGSMSFTIRLFADGGETVVEQQVQWNGAGIWHDVTTTTENGQPVPLP